MATSVVTTASMRLLRSADSHTGLVKKSAYQRIDRPGSGNTISVSDVKDSGKITRIGATRKIATAIGDDLGRDVGRPLGARDVASRPHRRVTAAVPTTWRNMPRKAKVAIRSSVPSAAAMPQFTDELV